MKTFVIEVLNKVTEIFRKKYYAVKKKKLKNSNFSIISSDCFGTFVYHNLGEQFRSPTINLYFSKEDFFVFATNLKEFLEVELVEKKNNDKLFPVGILEYCGNVIEVNFMHYKTFEDAKSKWETRKKRVDFSNIFIIQTIAQNVTIDDVEKFKEIPFTNKLLITKENNFKCENMVFHKIFNKKNYRPGELLEYKSRFSIKRNMDKINYVKFLNS